MALTAPQMQTARLIYGLGLQHGLSPARARELVAASYAESSLDPNNTNKSSGAAGLFQLLSSGYRQRAQALGGLYNPKANTLAILGDYVNYWRSHPAALPGEAARDVERSGMGSSFYSQPLSLIGQFGGAPQLAPTPTQPQPGPPVQAQPALAGAGTRALLAHALLSAASSGNYMPFFQTLRASRQAVTPPLPQTAVIPQTAAQTPTGARTGPPSVAPVAGYPLARHGQVIGVPYQGSHTLFGNWESDNAIDIAAPVGTPVYAVASGTIGSQIGPLNASDPHLAGNRLHLSTAGNEFYYAHLSRLAVHAGQHVQAGQLIGYSGSANGVAHLHIASRNGNPVHIFGH